MSSVQVIRSIVTAQERASSAGVSVDLAIALEIAAIELSGGSIEEASTSVCPVTQDILFHATYTVNR